jgi:hypothetical protein
MQLVPKFFKPASLFTLLLFLSCSSSTSSLADVEEVRLVQRGDMWDFYVTVRHDDTGWDHYADWWRVTTPDGEEIAKRELQHPHVDEQPFTRSLEGVRIPEGVTSIVVEAHDKVHGYGGKKVTVDITREEGPGYRLERE